jgi:polysaccharide export outer membrane protein
MKNENFLRNASCSATALSALMLVGCASTQNFLPSAGASRTQIQEVAQMQPSSNIQVVEINDGVARKVLGSKRQAQFSEVLDQTAQKAFTIGAGDVIEVSIWEAPPAALFGSAVLDPRAGPATTRATAFPEQMVNVEGFISIPFAGQIQAAGRTTNQIETEVAQRLKGKANQPQVLVRTIRNNTANVTVVGEVTNSLRMPLTAKGERLLDALAAAGGVRQPVNKMTLQVSRAGQMLAMPLEAVIRDPKQNIVLQPGDVVTSLFQPLSFTVLGATGKNEEVNFETQGISLAQALARAGGLQDARADAQGVFLFRFESPEAIEASTKIALTADGKIPVVYRLDLKDPATFFVAQNFPMQNRDVLYVSNSPAAELQKFLNILTSTIYSVSAIGVAVRTSP